MLVPVREICVQRLFVGDGLLHGVVCAYGSRLIGTVRVGERFAGQSLHKRSRRRNHRCLRRVPMAMVVIVVLEIFEDVADVQKCVAVQSDVYERRLHTRKHAGNAAFVDAADQRELFFALNVDFD